MTMTLIICRAHWKLNIELNIDQWISRMRMTEKILTIVFAFYVFMGSNEFRCSPKNLNMQFRFSFVHDFTTFQAISDRARHPQWQNEIPCMWGDNFGSYWRLINWMRVCAEYPVFHLIGNSPVIDCWLFVSTIGGWKWPCQRPSNQKFLTPPCEMQKRTLFVNKRCDKAR